MLFKQFRLFQLNPSVNYSSGNIEKYCEKFPFRSCMPSLPLSSGWVGILDEDDSPMIRTVSNCIVFCAQFEEKILPAAVVQKALRDKVKEIEKKEGRVIRQKEKWSMKDDIIMTLLPRAFSKFTKVYAYIDSRHHWLIVGTTNEKKTEQFLTLFKKTMDDEAQPFALKKIPSILTNWVKEKNYPDSLNVEKKCVLQDPDQFNRVIRCQEQNLFSTSIQGLIKEGCEVKQLGLSWQDQINFVLHDDFSIRCVKFQDSVLEQSESMEPETNQQQFDADFIIIQAVFSTLIKKLLDLFKEPVKAVSHAEELV